MLDILESDSTADKNPLDASIPPTSNQEVAEENHSVPIFPCKDLPRKDLVELLEVEKMFYQEVSLWESHPGTVSLITGQKPCRMSRPEREIGVSHQYGIVNTSKYSPDRAKDFLNIPIYAPSTLPFCIQSSEQHVLREIQKVFGYSPATKFQLQFAPRWILDKSISIEPSNYDGAYKEVNIKSLPPRSNIISSHHFFQLNKDGEHDKLNQKF